MLLLILIDADALIIYIHCSWSLKIKTVRGKDILKLLTFEYTK